MLFIKQTQQVCSIRVWKYQAAAKLMKMTNNWDAGLLLETWATAVIYSHYCIHQKLVIASLPSSCKHLFHPVEGVYYVVGSEDFYYNFNICYVHQLKPILFFLQSYIILKVDVGNFGGSQKPPPQLAKYLYSNAEKLSYEWNDHHTHTHTTRGNRRGGAWPRVRGYTCATLCHGIIWELKGQIHNQLWTSDIPEELLDNLFSEQSPFMHPFMEWRHSTTNWTTIESTLISCNWCIDWAHLRGLLSALNWDKLIVGKEAY